MSSELLQGIAVSGLGTEILLAKGRAVGARVGADGAELVRPVIGVVVGTAEIVSLTAGTLVNFGDGLVFAVTRDGLDGE